MWDLLTLFNFATVNLSDFSHSALIFLTNSLEALPLSKVLVAFGGHVVQVFVAVVEFRFEFKFSSFALGGLPCFLLTCVVSNDFVLCA